MSESPAATQETSLDVFPGEGIEEIVKGAPAANAASAGPEPKGESTEVGDDLRSRASEYGFTDEEISEYQPDQLQSMVDRIESQAFRRYAALREQQIQPESPADPSQQGIPPAWGGQTWQQPQVGGPAPPQQQQQQQQQPPGPLQPFEIKLKADEYDDALVKTLQDMNSHYQQQVSQISQALQEQQAFVYHQVMQTQLAQQAEFDRWFDDTIVGLGDDYRSVFGEGPGHQLPQGSEALRHREKAYIDYQLYLEYRGLPPATRDDELLSRLVRTDSRFAPKQTKQLSEQLKRNAAKTIGRPSGRKTTLEDTVMNRQTGTPQSFIDDLQRQMNDARTV